MILGCSWPAASSAISTYANVGPACRASALKCNDEVDASISTAVSAARAERKKLKRRASKAGDELHSDQESGERMSDGNHHPAGGHGGGGGAHSNADMSTALVQYNQQHSQDFAAMLRGYPEISEVPSPAQVLQRSYPSPFPNPNPDRTNPDHPAWTPTVRRHGLSRPCMQSADTRTDVYVDLSICSRHPCPVPSAHHLAVGLGGIKTTELQPAIQAATYMPQSSSAAAHTLLRENGDRSLHTFG